MKFHIRFPYSDRMLCGRSFPTLRVPWVSTANWVDDTRVSCQSCLAAAANK